MSDPAFFGASLARFVVSNEGVVLDDFVQKACESVLADAQKTGAPLWVVRAYCVETRLAAREEFMRLQLLTILHKGGRA